MDVPNAQPGAYQLNCNAESEKAHGAKVLGDACDPVPCPKFTAVGEAGAGKGVEICTGKKFEVWTCMTQFQLKELEFTPVGSSGTGEAPGSPAYRGVEVPVEVASTRVRYCIDRLNVKCGGSGSVSDDLAKADLVQETPDSIYWRTTVNGAPRTVSALSARTYERAQPAESVAWDYNQDFVTWAGAGYGVPSLDDAAIFGKKFSGRMWFHGDTSVGMAGGPADMTAKTGVHVKADAKVPAEQLANHYVDMFPKLSSFEAGAVDGPWPPIKLDPCIGATCNAGPEVIHDCMACTVFDPGGVAVHPGDVKVVGNVPGLGPSVLSEAGGYLPLAPGALSPEVVSLLGSNAVQVAAVEPVRSVGQGARVPQSLFVSSDGVRLLGAITVLGDSVLTTDVARRMLLARGGRTLDASGEATAAWTPETVPDAVEVAEGEPVPPPGPAGIPVYSAYLGELLLVRSGGAGAGAGEVWRRDVRSTAGWQRVVLGATALGTVKAATYTYGDGAMWVLDEVRGALGLRFARLVRVGLDGSGAKVMASWPKVGVYDTHWLLVDRDGGLVLVASSTKTLSHAVAKLSTSGGGLHVAALRFAQGGLAVPPVIDRNGYRFFVKRHKKDHLVDTVRLDALAPSSLPLGHVGGCF